MLKIVLKHCLFDLKDDEYQFFFIRLMIFRIKVDHRIRVCEKASSAGVFGEPSKGSRRVRGVLRGSSSENMI